MPNFKLMPPCGCRAKLFINGKARFSRVYKTKAELMERVPEMAAYPGVTGLQFLTVYTDRSLFTDYVEGFDPRLG